MLGAVRKTCSRSAVRVRDFRGVSSYQYPVRAFSTTEDAAAKEEDDDASKNKQAFVTTTIEPQEWDVRRKDPLFRPKFRSNAKILSRHDYARINGVSFEEQYQTFEDAMITLSWLDHKQQRRIYGNYLNWMVSAQEKFGKTSHEYVCRLLGQKYNITPFRAAAIIQLQHNEEQQKLNDPGLDLGDQAEIMDSYMKHTIKEAYRSTGEKPPEGFVEPLDMAGGMESYKTVAIEDLMDVDQLTRDANFNDQERARSMINNHNYIEDVDEFSIKIPMSKDAMKLINMKEKLKAQAPADPKPSPVVSAAAAAAPKKKEKKARWQFVAQVIDTRILHPKLKRRYAKDGRKLWGRKHRNGFQQDWAENSLIEEDGTLRPANFAEVRHMPWKPLRHVQEFTYAGAKQGWLDRTVRGNNSAWGKAPDFEGEDKTDDEEEEKVITEILEGADSDASSDSDSDEGETSSDSDGSSSDEEKADEDEEAKEDDDGSSSDEEKADKDEEAKDDVDGDDNGDGPKDK